MPDNSLDVRLADLEIALERLREALAEPESNPLLIDGIIQRFEFTFELTWKVMQLLLREQGITENSPRAVLKAAYLQGWLEDEDVWLQLLDARNLSSHTYRESLAAEIVEEIRMSFTVIEATFRTLHGVKARLSDSA